VELKENLVILFWAEFTEGILKNQRPRKAVVVSWTQNNCELQKRHSKRGKKMAKSLSEHV
jgi:hypothetical protein